MLSQNSIGSSFLARSALAGMIVTAIATSSAMAVAGTIAASMGVAPASSTSDPISISTGTTDWVYYGLTGNTSMDTKSSGPASFSALSTNDSNGLDNSPTSSSNIIGFSGGNPTASTSDGLTYTYTGEPQAASPATITFTQILVAPSETVNIYLASYDAKSSISASLSSGGSYASDAALPQGVGTTGDATGGGSLFGLLTLNVTGTTGDVLTITDTSDFTGVSSSNYGNIGVQAASVVATPEPATLCLFEIGGLALLARRRMARKAT